MSKLEKKMAALERLFGPDTYNVAKQTCEQNSQLTIALESLRSELEQVRVALDNVGCPIGNEHKSYTQPERIAGLGKSAQYFMCQTDQLRTELAEAKEKLNESKAIVSRVWIALDIASYEEAKPYSVDEHVTRLKTQLAEARRDKKRAEATIDAMKRFANFNSTTWGFIHNQVNAAMSAQTKEAR